MAEKSQYPNQDIAQPESDDLCAIEDRLKNLRSRISDDAQAIDTYKAKTAAALAAGVFLFLLAAGAVYDLITGNTSLWFRLEIRYEQLYWITGVLSVASLSLLLTAFARERRRDRSREARLDELEQEFSLLLELKESLSKGERG